MGYTSTKSEGPCGNHHRWIGSCLIVQVFWWSNCLHCWVWSWAPSCAHDKTLANIDMLLVASIEGVQLLCQLYQKSKEWGFLARRGIVLWLEYHGCRALTLFDGRTVIVKAHIFLHTSLVIDEIEPFGRFIFWTDIVDYWQFWHIWHLQNLSVYYKDSTALVFIWRFFFSLELSLGSAGYWSIEKVLHGTISLLLSIF